MAGLATGPTRCGLCDASCVVHEAPAPHTDHRTSCNEPAGLYIHVPVCRSKCRYCGFYSVPVDQVDAGRLVDALLRELNRHEGVEFCTAYVGGGSPTALLADELLRLIRAVGERCPWAEEFTVECNPGQVDAALLSELRQAGVNRLSFGAQSLLAHELKMLGRRHSVEQIGSAVAMARRAGFENVGLDLIFAIPGSTLADWQASLDATIALGVEHVSAYSLSFEAGTPFEVERRAGRLTPVDEELDRAMYESTIERLEQAGLVQYEISNFARAGRECRHNLGYWANRPYVGIGPAAASYLAGVEGRRITNDADVERYLAAVERGDAAPAEVRTVSEADMVCETAVLNLRRRSGIELAEFRRRTGRDTMRTFAEPIEQYRKLGLIEIVDRAVRLTRRALPIADTVLCDFAALD